MRRKLFAARNRRIEARGAMRKAARIARAALRSAQGPNVTVKLTLFEPLAKHWKSPAMSSYEKP